MLENHVLLINPNHFQRNIEFPRILVLGLNQHFHNHNNHLRNIRIIRITPRRHIERIRDDFIGKIQRGIIFHPIAIGSF